MKKLLVLSFFLCCFSISNAAEPIVEIAPLPSDERLEVYEESEEIFTEKVMGYYQDAIYLSLQIKYLGKKCTVSVLPPTYEELGEMDIAIIKKYYILAKKLESKVKAIPDNGLFNDLKALRTKIQSITVQNNQLLAKLTNYKIQQKNIEFYRNSWEESREEISRLHMTIDSTKAALDKKIFEREGQVRRLYEKDITMYSPILSVGGFVNKFFIRDRRIDEKVSFGASMTLNPEPIFGFGKYLEFSGQYMSPRISTLGKHGTVDKWNMNLYAVGLNAKIPNAIKLDNFYASLKLGVSHYWGDGKLDNVAYGNAEMSGEFLHLELSFFNSNVDLPIELYLAYESYFASKMLFESKNNTISLNKPQFNVFQLGLRLALWKVPVY